MQFRLSFSLLLLCSTEVTSFTPPIHQHQATTNNVKLNKSVLSVTKSSSPKADIQPRQNNKNTKQQKNVLQKAIQGSILTTLLTALLFTTGNMPVPTISKDLNTNKVVMESVNWNVANAKEMASGTGSRVNKDPNSLLRLGLPIKNKEVRKLQKVIENIQYDIASKRKSAAVDGVKETRKLIKSSSSKYLPSCRTPTTCTEILTNMDSNLGPLEAALKDSMEVTSGSDQERKALDEAYKSHEKLLTLITDLEEQMVPNGYVTKVPEMYSELPQLQGRATVEMVFKKPDGGVFTVLGNNYPQAQMKMVIDGYAAPLTSGNFIDLVQKGFYDKMPIQRSDGFVVQTGDPKGDAWGYVGKGTKSIGNGPHGERLIPNEILVVGESAPIYESTLEDEGKGGQATVLPFNSYGAMGWARDEYDPNSGSSQFFWLLFDSDLTPAGKNVIDGRYPCFGYVVEGEDFLRDLREEDIIVSATVTSGAQNLIQPK